MKITLPRLRWIIAALLLLVTLINYADRGTLGVLKDEVCRDLNLTEIDYSHLVSVFFVAYAVMYAASGCVVDWIGARWSMALFVCLWSISQMCHGLATGKWSFAACRVGLGFAEPGSFPAATKAIGEWFAPRQRALAVGIFNAGAVLGIALTPPLAAWLALHYGWRAAFLFTGALGIVWILAWLAFYDSPGRHRWLKPIETDGVKATEPVTENGPEQTVSRRMGALEIVSSRPGSLLIAARFLTDP
ncbi:MAG TPA: MFS transporter, partial [Verrucomicrobiae bacterium]|nr:MFS transporter [Verrucomicrobiae bacterium]